MAFTAQGANLKYVKNKPQENMLTINAQIKSFIYTDDESGFYVLSMQIPDTQANISVVLDGKQYVQRKFVAVGTSSLVTASIAEGQEVELTGSFGLGKEAGSIQFNVTSILECIPTKPKAIELFLGSGKIHGIGPKIAKKIVNRFGTDTLNILDHDSKQLLEIDGVNEKKLEIIDTSWKEWRSVYEILATMKLYQVGDVAGLKIFNHFKEKAIYVIKNEPYMLTEVDSIGFRTADQIAKSIGISPHDEKRIEKCIFYTLEELSNKGNTAYPKDTLVLEVNDILDIDAKLIEERIEDLIQREELIEKNVKMKVVTNKFKGEFKYQIKKGVAHKKFHYSEVRIAKELQRINTKNDHINVDKINEFLSENPNKLDESQIAAARTILSNKVSVLTGGPGTGKTHTIKSLLQFFDEKEKNVIMVEGDAIEYPVRSVLAAPTGRAAKRIQESTQQTSSTLHRLLGYKEGGFIFNESNKLKGDVFIVDESSMVDLWLAMAFLKAVPDDARVIFVGDTDQLPSVGAGKFLDDLIDSGKIAVARLSVIHRQALNSQIIVASHDIIHRKMPTLHSIDSDSDFVFLEAEGNEDIHEKIVEVVHSLIEKDISSEEIQILTPKKESEVGTRNLNQSLRPMLNKYYANHQDLTTKFVPGDRVMQFKNNKDLEIYNGDIGTVVSVDEEMQEIRVKFDDKIHTLAGQQLSELDFSYASTIHKSQGSDYPYVIIPLSKSHTFMWDSKLLYTGVTRGKKRVILIGEKKTLLMSVAQFKQVDRITGLKDEILKTHDIDPDDVYRQQGIEFYTEQPKQVFSKYAKINQVSDALDIAKMQDEKVSSQPVQITEKKEESAPEKRYFSFKSKVLKA